MKLRARREEDKSRRTDAILTAGREIWSRKSSTDFTMTDVAERAGIVKGTLYLYFETREDLLAALSERILSEYLDRVDRVLETRKRWTLGKVAELFADGVRLPIVPQNQATRDRLAATAELIDARVPGLRRGDSTRFLLCATALLAGLGRNRREFRYGVAALAHGMERRR